jgi:predicted nucleic acid-binding protein
MPATIVDYSSGIQFVSSVYLDSNLLIYARDRGSIKYRIASLVLADLFSSRTNLFITNLVIDECAWAFLRAYYRIDNSGQILKPSIIKKNPYIIAKYHWRIASNIKKILNLPRLTIGSNLVPSENIIKQAINLMKTQLLMPRDAFHLSFIINLNLQGVVTSNGDFDNLNLRKNLIVYKY